MRAAADPTSAKQAELILRELDSLPTLPSVAARLMSVTSSDNAEIREVIKLIEADPAVTAKVLSLCSRAAVGMSRQVTTVDRAVVMLGLDAVRAAVLSLQVVDWMRQVGMGSESDAGPARARRRRLAEAAAGGGRPFDHVNFWRHSIAVACAAELLTKLMTSARDGRAGEAFVAGLMHDLGKPALALALPRAYGRIIELAEARQGDIAEVERSIIGLDHHDAGKRLAERWGLPEPIRDVMWLHNQSPSAVPASAPRRLIGIVSLADALCRRLHLGWSGTHTAGNAAGSIDEQCAALGLNVAKVEGLIPAIVEELSQRSEALGLSSQPGERVLLESVLAANRQLGRLSRSLEQRSRAADQRGRILEAIASFHRQEEPIRTQLGALLAVARSAAQTFGEGYYAAIAQSEPGKPWLIARFTPDGALAGASAADPPVLPGAEDGEPVSLANLASRDGGLGGSIPMARWLGEQLGAEADGKDLRFLPLIAPGQRAAALLVHDRVLGAAATDERQLGALIASWAAAIGAASDTERIASLGEQLAHANRVLQETQKKLAEVESMARLGELTAGAAHEMNNPLAVISGRAQFLMATSRDDTVRSAADAIVTAAQRLTDLITRLHVIATPPKPRYASVSVQDMLANVVRQAKERTTARSPRASLPSVRVVVTAPVPPARLDRDIIGRAVLELVVNALECGGGGSAGDGVEIRVGPEMTLDGEVLAITVSDSGPGMDERTLRHAFDPFFSHKPAGRQAGLGLPTAKRLVETHGGTLELRSRPHEGTTATIRIPGWRSDQPEADSSLVRAA